MAKDEEDPCQINVPKKKRNVSKNVGVKKALFHQQTTEDAVGDIKLIYFLYRLYFTF